MSETTPTRDDVGVFPPRRVFNRARLRAVQALNGLVGAAVIAAAFALFGAFATLPHKANWVERFYTGLGVAVIALAVVWGLATVAPLCWYRLHGRKDGTWEPIWRDSNELSAPGKVVFQLVCRVHPPIPVESLGYMECAIKRPDGTVELVSGDDINRLGRVPRSPELPEVPAAHFWYPLRGLSGQYEVRWYGSTANRKLYEITRATFQVR
jgi:hypothetical protein